MCAERPDQIGRIEVRHGFQALLHPLGKAHAVAGERNLAEGLRFVRRALDVEAAIFVYDVLFGRLEHVRRELLALVDDLTGGHADGHPANREAAAAVCAVTECRALRRIAVTELDAVVRHAELVGNDLAECGFVTLAV